MRQLEELLALDFAGTVGIVTFFAPQAKQINELAASRIGARGLARLNVKVFTANRFQGDERDVMLLSLCLAPNMPAGARNFPHAGEAPAERRGQSRADRLSYRRRQDLRGLLGHPAYRNSGAPGERGRCAASRHSRRSLRQPLGEHLHDAMVERGLDPIVQHPVAGRYLDLAIVDETRSPPLRLDIEVDGVAYHTDDDGNRLATDLWRDHQLGRSAGRSCASGCLS